jgi:hypothetical protein
MSKDWFKNCKSIVTTLNNINHENVKQVGDWLLYLVFQFWLVAIATWFNITTLAEDKDDLPAKLRFNFATKQIFDHLCLLEPHDPNEFELQMKQYCGFDQVMFLWKQANFLRMNWIHTILKPDFLNQLAGSFWDMDGASIADVLVTIISQSPLGNTIIYDCQVALSYFIDRYKHAFQTSPKFYYIREKLSPKTMEQYFGSDDQIQQSQSPQLELPGLQSPDAAVSPSQSQSQLKSQLQSQDDDLPPKKRRRVATAPKPKVLFENSLRSKAVSTMLDSIHTAFSNCTGDDDDVEEIARQIKLQKDSVVKDVEQQFQQLIQSVSDELKQNASQQNSN